MVILSFSLSATWLVVFSWRWKASLECKRKSDSSFITSRLSIIASLYNQSWNSSTYHFPLTFPVWIFGRKSLKKPFSSLKKLATLKPSKTDEMSSLFRKAKSISTKIVKKWTSKFLLKFSFCSSVLSVFNHFVRVKQDISNRWSTTCKWSSAYQEKVFPVSRFSTYFPKFSSACPLGNSKNCVVLLWGSLQILLLIWKWLEKNRLNKIMSYHNSTSLTPLMSAYFFLSWLLTKKSAIPSKKLIFLFVELPWLNHPVTLAFGISFSCLI